MATRPLLYYLPILPITCMIFMIIGVGIWSHFTMVVVRQSEYAVKLLGPTVTAPELHRGEESVKGTSSSYMLFACGLFGLGLYHKILRLEQEMSGSKTRELKIYRIVNSVLHFIWWMIMVWLVVLMMGLAAMAIQVWVGHHAVKQVLTTQQEAQPSYDRLAADNTSAVAKIGNGTLAAAGGDMLHAVLLAGGWPPPVACPSTCANLLLFQFLEVDEAFSCVCNKETLNLVVEATRKALDAVPGMLVGIWFMFIFGDFFKTSLACDFTNAMRDADSDRGAPAAGLRSQSVGRAYVRL